MVIMILENVTPSVRGELSKWLIEVSAGVFVGKVNAMVREELWEYFTGKAGEKGRMMQIWNTNTEQGFDIKTHNPGAYCPSEYEGLWLITKPPHK